MFWGNHDSLKLPVLRNKMFRRNLFPPCNRPKGNQTENPVPGRELHAQITLFAYEPECIRQGGTSTGCALASSVSPWFCEAQMFTRCLLLLVYLWIADLPFKVQPRTPLPPYLQVANGPQPLHWLLGPPFLWGPRNIYALTSVFSFSYSVSCLFAY